MPKGQKFVSYPSVKPGTTIIISKDYKGPKKDAVVVVPANNPAPSIGPKHKILSNPGVLPNLINKKK